MIISRWILFALPCRLCPCKGDLGLKTVQAQFCVFPHLVPLFCDERQAIFAIVGGAESRFWHKEVVWRDSAEAKAWGANFPASSSSSWIVAPCKIFFCRDYGLALRSNISKTVFTVMLVVKNHRIKWFTTFAFESKRRYCELINIAISFTRREIQVYTETLSPLGLSLFLLQPSAVLSNRNQNKQP
jgi:hypothetical protein